MSQYNWASEASPTLGCSIEISRDKYIYTCNYLWKRDTRLRNTKPRLELRSSHNVSTFYPSRIGNSMTCTNTLDIGIHQTTVFFGL